jgi:hypothetical protein
VVELRRGTKGTVNRWLAHHVAEVGGGSARRDGARGEAAALSQLKEEEGCRPPPPPLGEPVGPQGLCRPIG